MPAYFHNQSVKLNNLLAISLLVSDDLENQIYKHSFKPFLRQDKLNYFRYNLSSIFDFIIRSVTSEVLCTDLQ